MFSCYPTTQGSGRGDQAPGRGNRDPEDERRRHVGPITRGIGQGDSVSGRRNQDTEDQRRGCLAITRGSGQERQRDTQDEYKTDTCSICYDKPTGVQRSCQLSCEHILCEKCLVTINGNSCRYQDGGSIDRAAMLKEWGYPEEEQLLPPAPLRPQYARVAPALPDVVQVQPVLPQGLTTVEVCVNEQCPAGGATGKVVHNTNWPLGRSNLSKSANLRCDHCSHMRLLQKLIFHDCHVQVSMVEVYANGEKVRKKIHENGADKTSTIDMPGHYASLVVSTSGVPLPAED